MQSVVERIKERLSIADVLSSYITLVEAGSQYKARCPFHNERTPSFYVTPDRGFYYCFGCGVKGDIFTFVQEFEGLDFNGALTLLAERAGVPLVRDAFKHDETAPVYEALETATVLYEEHLAQTEHALEYLARRGVTKETIKKFRIGYAPDAWDFIARGFKGTKEAVAIRAGLIKRGDKGVYDRFRTRIMFPLTDASGRVVGFSGRLFPDSEEGAKYLNTAETELFQKSKLLYGFDKAKFDIKRKNFAILVEGQFDLVLSHQAGFTNTVATSGTALSDDSTENSTSNLGIVSKLSKNIILAFDGDAAGEKAIDRAARIALTLGMNPKVAALPKGTDPASYIQDQGAAGWKEVLQYSEHVVVFQVKNLIAKKLSPHRFASLLVEQVFPYLALIPSSIERNKHLELVSASAGIPHRALIEDFEHFLARQEKAEGGPGELVKPSKMVFDIPTVYLGILSWQSSLADPAIDPVAYREKAQGIVFEEHQLSLPDLDEEALHSARAYVTSQYSLLGKDALLAVLDDLLHQMTVSFLQSLRSHYTALLSSAEQKGNEEEMAILLPILHRLTVRLHDLKALDK